MEIVINPNINGKRYYMKGVTEDEVAHLNHDYKNLSNSAFFSKYKILKSDCVATVNTKQGGTNIGILSSIVPNIVHKQARIYFCYANNKYLFASESEAYHEHPSCSVVCAIQQLGNPDFCFVYRKPIPNE